LLPAKMESVALPLIRVPLGLRLTCPSVSHREVSLKYQEMRAYQKRARF
jgi:hypothetical protein